MTFVLLIEDDPDLRLLLETWLTRLGYGSLSAASALEAVKTLAGSEDSPGPVVDVALLDIVAKPITRSVLQAALVAALA